MASVNKVILIGNLGADAELRHTQGGQAVANLRLATTDTWKDRASGERQERTEWHRVVLWGPRAESLQQYLVKGKQLYVEGSLQTRKWDDRDGNTRYTTEIRADNIEFLGRRGEGDGGEYRQDYRPREQQPGAGGSGAGSAAGAGAGDGSGAPELADDDIPF